MKIKSVNVIDVHDWDQLVIDTYEKPYSFQQQDDCKDRGHEYISVPAPQEDYENNTLPEIINGEEMGVSFKAWLERDPNAPLNPTDEELAECNYFYREEDKIKWCESESHINMFYERNFYPHVNMIINDLHARGLLPAGEYMIDIDW